MPARRRGAAHPQRDASGLERAGDRHARHVGVAVETQPALGELRPAGAQAAAVQRGGVESRESARPAGRFEQLQRELAGEVGERELDRLQSPPGPTAVPVRGGDVGEPLGGQRREALHGRRRPGGAGADRLHAHSAGEPRAQRLARTRRGLALERRVPGVGYDEQVRVGDLRGERAGVGRGGAQVVGAADDQRGDVGHGFRRRPGARGWRTARRRRCAARRSRACSWE